MATNNTTKRTYGKQRTLGDIIYNPATKSVFCSINLGFFGKTTVTLVKRQDDGAYDLMKAYTDRNGQEQVVCVGKTFPAKKTDGTLVENVTKGTLGLLSRYDSEKRKNVTDSSDALFITTHKLKESKALGDSGMLKVGFITGVFGIEDDIASNNGNASANTQAPYEPAPDYDDDGEPIPF